MAPTQRLGQKHQNQRCLIIQVSFSDKIGLIPKYHVRALWYLIFDTSKSSPVILCTVSGLVRFSLTNPLWKAYYLIFHLLFFSFCSSADLSGKRSSYIQALGEFPPYSRNTDLLCDLLSWCVSEAYSKGCTPYLSRVLCGFNWSRTHDVAEKVVELLILYSPVK